MKDTEYEYNHRAAATPPIFGRVATFRFYAETLGHKWRCPRTVRQYVEYKYWCITHQYDAIAGCVQPEEEAFEAYKTYHEEREAEWKHFLENVLDE